MDASNICPFLKEVVMLYCDACPVKKLLPRNQVVSIGPCANTDHERCPLYQEMVRGASEAALRDEGRTGRRGAEVRP